MGNDHQVGHLLRSPEQRRDIAAGTDSVSLSSQSAVGSNRHHLGISRTCSGVTTRQTLSDVGSIWFGMPSAPQAKAQARWIPAQKAVQLPRATSTSLPLPSVYGTKVNSGVGPKGSQREGAAAHRHFEAHTLPALGYPHASVLTLKAFRAGHATELGRQGKSLGVILQSGDWRSATYFVHPNQDEVDAAVSWPHRLGTSTQKTSCVGHGIVGRQFGQRWVLIALEFPLLLVLSAMRAVAALFQCHTSQRCKLWLRWKEYVCHVAQSCVCVRRNW